ncbi:hypothetical protein [Mobiluncus mulieris]|uniref:hypothetical protein n=1 Tax=Mobiluncus mulieris TaxID=2052 RepID=UPI00209380BD|nr:hypothetical protein [Mobiluncus mulieris]
MKMDISDEMPCSSPRDAMNHRYAQLCEKYASSAVEILGDMLTRSFGVLDGLLKTGVTNQHKKIKFDIYIPSGNRETPAGS